MIIDTVKIGILMKTYANYASNSQEDISFVSYYVKERDYHKILRYHFSTGSTNHERKTIYQYLFYVIFRKIHDNDKEYICKQLSKFMLGLSVDSIFPENKRDPLVAPISSKKRDDKDKLICSVIRTLEIPLPTFSLVLPKYEIGKNEENFRFYQDIYSRKRPGEQVWAKWYVKNKNHIPSNEARFDEFMKLLFECDNWTTDGLISFLYNQSILSPEIRKVMAELENKNSLLSFCMFLALKKQNINKLDIKGIVLLYEDSFNILQSNITLKDVHFLGYKEVHAHTRFDIKRLDFKLLNKTYSYVYSVPHVISNFRVEDEYEDALVSYISKRGLLTIPRKIHSDLFRKAAEKYGDYTNFIEQILTTNK